MNTINKTITAAETGQYMLSRGKDIKEAGQDGSKSLFDHFTDGLGTIAGVVTGSASIPFHVIPGAVKGAHEALAAEKGQKNDIPFQGTFVTQNYLLGAGAGIAAAGVFGCLGGTALSALATWMLEKKAEKSNTYEKMVETIENKVDGMTGAHPGGSSATLIGNATEGALIGAFEGARTGAKVGYSIGFDATKSAGKAVEWAGKKVEYAAERTIGDSVAGVAEGAWEAGKGLAKSALGPHEGPVEAKNPERKGLRRLLGAVLGAPLGAVSMATSALSGLLSGGITGISHEASGINHLAQDACSTLGFIGAGSAAGMAAGGPAGAFLGGLGGALYAHLSHRSDAPEKIVRSTSQKVLKAVSDNDPDAYFMKRITRDFTEGTIVGGFHNAAGGFRKGVDSGAGIVSGLFEGTKCFAGAVGGSYETDGSAPTPQKAERKGLIRGLASLPGNLLKAAAGSVTGAASSAMAMIDGSVQGTAIALRAKEKASSAMHERVLSAGAILAAGAAGFALGGAVLPAVAGGIVAACGAGLIHKLNGKTGASKKAVEGITSAIRHAQKDNSYMNVAGQKHTIYEVFRDGVQGSMTGAGAGIREGFREGYSLGSGFMDGVFNTVKDLGKHLSMKAR
jgi:hypothetical protein